MVVLGQWIVFGAWWIEPGFREVSIVLLNIDVGECGCGRKSG